MRKGTREGGRKGGREEGRREKGRKGRREKGRREKGRNVEKLVNTPPTLVPPGMSTEMSLRTRSRPGR